VIVKNDFRVSFVKGHAES